MKRMKSRILGKLGMIFVLSFLATSSLHATLATTASLSTSTGGTSVSASADPQVTEFNTYADFLVAVKATAQSLGAPIKTTGNFPDLEKNIEWVVNWSDVYDTDSHYADACTDHYTFRKTIYPGKSTLNLCYEIEGKKVVPSSGVGIDPPACSLKRAIQEQCWTTP